LEAGARKYPKNGGADGTHREKNVRLFEPVRDFTAMCSDLLNHFVISLTELAESSLLLDVGRDGIENTTHARTKIGSPTSDDHE
jgi:hypothetical protein